MVLYLAKELQALTFVAATKEDEAMEVVVDVIRKTLVSASTAHSAAAAPIYTMHSPDHCSHTTSVSGCLLCKMPLVKLTHASAAKFMPAAS